jgi:type II secretion system protein G
MILVLREEEKEPATMRHRRSAGFTLIELLITVAIIGILVAIAVVNYRAAIDRARQRRSMSDMRSLASAMEAYAADLDRYPPSAAFTLPPDLPLPTDTLLVARPYLQPTYMRLVPVADGWNSWFLYGTTPEKPTTPCALQGSVASRRPNPPTARARISGTTSSS